ncbi:MAG: hypothetical protein KDI79_22395 [Anaerolineae bacterium]|nr:hypothetical protein [Anaerolineae bacterium]
MSFRAYGTHFGIRVTDPHVLERLQPHLPLGWEPAVSARVDFMYSLVAARASQRQGTRSYHLLYAGSGRIARTQDFDELCARLASHLELVTAFLAKNCLFVHAGVVGWQGKAIIIPGRSFSGKTSLVTALIKNGATYYSDEFAILDSRGWVHPYPSLLSVRQGYDLNTKKYRAEELGGQVGVEPLPVGLVVITQYQPAAPWRPLKLSPAQAMLALMNNTVAALRGPEVSLPILKQVVLQAKTIKSKRGEAEDVVPLLQKLVSASQR